MGTAQVKAPGETLVAPNAQSLIEWVLSDRRRFEHVVTCFEIVADLVTITLSVLAAYWAYEILHVGRRTQYAFAELLIAAIAFGVLFVVLLNRDGSYTPTNSLLGIRETERVLRVSLTAFGIVFCVTFFSAHHFSRGILACSVALAPLALACEKQCIYHIVRHLHSRGYGIQNVLIYGAGATGRRVFSALVRSPKLGLRPVAIVDDNQNLVGTQVYESGYRRDHSLPIISGPITRDLIRRHDIGLLLLGIPSLARDQRDRLAHEASGATCSFAFVPQMSHSSDNAGGPADLDGILVASLMPDSSKPFYEIGKRLFDVVASIVLVFLTAPVWAFIALLIRLDSRGPVFFQHTRVGLNGVTFSLYKFRSMYVNASKYGYHPRDSNDPRVTRVGRWLRRTSLDELPQLLNVIKGEMSLVGPRPEMPFIVDGYNEEQRQRLVVPPGLTGLWQLSADRAFSIHENLHYDLYYIRNRNFFMDIALLLHTAMFAMRGV